MTSTGTMERRPRGRVAIPPQQVGARGAMQGALSGARQAHFVKYGSWKVVTNGEGLSCWQRLSSVCSFKGGAFTNDPRSLPNFFL